MEIFSTLLALCVGNSPVTKSSDSDVFFDLRLSKRWSKQSRRRLFESPSRSLWRHCNVLCSIPPWEHFSGWALVAWGYMAWASCQIRNIAVAHAPGMPATFSPPPRVKDHDMHHGTCVTHVPWCMPGSLTIGFLWSQWRRKRSQLFRRMRNSPFYVSGKRPMDMPVAIWCHPILGSLWQLCGTITPLQ